IVLEPPPSTKPRPKPQLAPSCASHPPPHAQCANSGYVHPASRAVEAQIAPNRQRSAPELSGIIPANPTLNICSNITSAAGERSSRSPRRKKGSAAIQPQVFPATTNPFSGRPAAPCQAKPTITYTNAATAVTQSAPTKPSAALRDLPNPELISAKPAPANGTSRMRSKQNTADTSERVRREGATKSVTLLPPAGPDEHAPPARARTTLPPCRPARIQRAHRPMAAARQRPPQSPIPQPARIDPRVSYSSISKNSNARWHWPNR